MIWYYRTKKGVTEIGAPVKSAQKLMRKRYQLTDLQTEIRLHLKMKRRYKYINLSNKQTTLIYFI